MPQVIIHLFQGGCWLMAMSYHLSACSIGRNFIRVRMLAIRFIDWVKIIRMTYLTSDLPHPCTSTIRCTISFKPCQQIELPIIDCSLCILPFTCVESTISILIKPFRQQQIWVTYHSITVKIKWRVRSVSLDSMLLQLTLSAHSRWGVPDRRDFRFLSHLSDCGLNGWEVFFKLSVSIILWHFMSDLKNGQWVRTSFNSCAAS